MLWKGIEWTPRSWAGGPGFGKWSAANAFVDGNGHLVLRITNPNGNDPVGAEVNGTKSFGYGTYRTVVEGRLDLLHRNHVFGGLFPYFGGAFPNYVEFDMCEASAWDTAEKPFLSANSWWSGALSDRTHSRFPIGTAPVHTFVGKWEPGKFTYDGYEGEGTSGKQIMHVEHTKNIPVPSGKDIPIYNLWLYANGTPSAAAKAAPPVTIKIRDFSHTPLGSTPPPPPPPPPPPTPVSQVKTQAKGASRRIVLEAANEGEWSALAKVYGKDPNKIDETVT